MYKECSLVKVKRSHLQPTEVHVVPEMRATGPNDGQSTICRC